VPIPTFLILTVGSAKPAPSFMSQAHTPINYFSVFVFSHKNGGTVFIPCATKFLSQISRPTRKFDVDMP
jgi:hypothetical protein